MILFSPSLRHQSFSFLFIYSKPFTRSFSDLKPEIFFRADFSLSILCYYHTFSHTCFFPSFLLEKNHKAPSWPSSLWSPSSRPSFLHYHRSILATSQGKMCTASTYGPNVPDFSAFSSILLLTVFFNTHVCCDMGTHFFAILCDVWQAHSPRHPGIRGREW